MLYTTLALFLGNKIIDKITYPNKKETPYKSGSLKVQFKGNQNWILLEDLVYDDSDSNHIIVPKGFETNLASVPRFAWAYLSPWDVARAAVVHDYLYDRICKEENVYNREQADQIFYDAMKHSTPSVGKAKIWLAWKSVRVFGGYVIKLARKQNAEKYKTN